MAFQGLPLLDACPANYCSVLPLSRNQYAANAKHLSRIVGNGLHSHVFAAVFAFCLGHIAPASICLSADARLWADTAIDVEEA